jgi:hypothetical protein
MEDLTHQYAPTANLVPSVMQNGSDLGTNALAMTAKGSESPAAPDSGVPGAVAQLGQMPVDQTDDGASSDYRRLVNGPAAPGGAWRTVKFQSAGWGA